MPIKALSLFGTGLNGRQSDGIDDIVNQRTAGEVVHRLAQALQHRADRDHIS